MYNIWEEYGGLIIVGLFFLFGYLSTRIKKVEPGTVVIVDRNSHFYKKKRYGYYFFNPKTDKITTKISKSPVRESYKNTFITHDNCYYRVYFAITYKAVDLEMVLSSLEDSRRSIYDVVNCAVETTIGSLTSGEMDNFRPEVNEALYKQLESMLEPFYIDVTFGEISFRSKVDSSVGEKELFRKHISSGDNPVGNLEKSDEDPIGR